eukprot:5858624-Pleurochrysis_carterae.AAC.1
MQQRRRCSREDDAAEKTMQQRRRGSKEDDAAKKTMQQRRRCSKKDDAAEKTMQQRSQGNDEWREARRSQPHLFAVWERCVRTGLGATRRDLRAYGRVLVGAFA